MIDPVKQLLDILTLERLEVDLFRGHSPDTRVQRVFGGQVIGQALVAAYNTVSERTCHSLHAYFIHPGDPTAPIIYQVDRARDGRSFTTRRVVAIQHGRPIFNLAASFHIEEEGYEHQIDMPEGIPGPEGLPGRDAIADMLEKRGDASPKQIADFRSPQPVDVRYVDLPDYTNPKPKSHVNHVWLKATRELVDVNPVVHQCILAYASDLSLLDSGTRPHAVSWALNNVQLASLDHAMWFHAPVKADEWVLYAKDSPAAMGARSFNRGSIYRRDGTLIASVAQEGLMRPVRPRTSGGSD